MLTIGQLSELSGIPTSTIRFWERKGLLHPTAWTAGQRRYGDEARSQVAALRLCQDAGFTLAEIRQIWERREADPTAWRDFVRDKIVDITQRLEQLNRAHAMLSHALECPHEDITQWSKFVAAIDERRRPTRADPPIGRTTPVDRSASGS